MTTTRKSIAKLSLILLLLTIVVVTWSGATYSVVAHSHSHSHDDHHDHHHSDHAAHDHTHSHTDPKSMIKTAITTTTKATAKMNVNDGDDDSSNASSDNNNNNSNNAAWLYSLGASFFVSLLSFSGATLLFSTMSTRLQFFLTSLAIGSLLGDTFMHMLPAIYGTHSHSHGNSHDDGHGHHEHGEHAAAEFDYGLVILFGFLLCFFSEMIIRYRQNKAEKSTAPVASPSSAEHAVATTSALTHTRSTGHHHHHHHGHGHIKAFGWLNLFSDAIHNFMDGMGLAGAFQISTGLGIATTLCVCFHELPQELSDFGVLLSAGFSVKRALLFNFLSGVIAVVGCLFGLTLSQQASLLGGSWSNLLNEKALISVTAGSFLYITAGMTQELWSQIFTDEEEHSHEQGIGSKVELSSISKKQKRKDSSASSDQPLPRRKTTTAHGTTSNNTVKSNIVVSVVGLATGLILMRMIAQLEHSIMHAVSGF